MKISHNQMEKVVFWSFIAIVAIVLYLWDVFYKPEVSEYPTPTEFIEKKKKRKKHKQLRREWIDNMHRSSADINWKKIDASTRSEKNEIILNTRRNLSRTGIDNFNSLKEHIVNDIVGFWEEKGSNNLAGRIHTADIDFENGLIYCGSAGGNIWRGTLEGENWISLNDYMQIKDINMIRVLKNGNSKRIVISSSKGVYYTENEGLTIEKASGIEFLDSWGSIGRALTREEDGNMAIYILSEEGNVGGGSISCIYKSTDMGTSFTKIFSFNQPNGFSLSSSNNNNFDIWTLRYISSDLFVLHNNRLYTLNANNDLVLQSEINTSSTGDVVLTGGSSNNHVTLYARVSDEIYYSSNSGNTWVYRGEIPQWMFTKNSFNASLLSPENVYWGGMEAFHSDNGGQSWDLVNPWYDYYGNPNTKLHADIPEIRFYLTPDYVEIALISTDGGIYISYDGLQSVQNLSLNGLGVSQYYSTYTKRTNPYNIYVGSQDQGFQRAVNPIGGIESFEQVISGDYGHLVSGDDGNSLWCNYPGFTLFYDNVAFDANGLTLDFPGSNFLWIAPLMEDPNNAFKAYLGGGGSSGNHLIHLTASNNNIFYDQEAYNFDSPISAMAYSKINTDYRYILTENGRFYSSTNSSHDGWLLSNGFSGPGPQYFYGASIYVSENDLGTVYIAGSGYSNPGVYVTDNNGQSFTSMINGLPNTLVYDIVGTPEGNYLFAATEVGPYVYSKIENQWYDLRGTTGPDQTYWSVEFIQEINTVRFGTYGRGIWDFVIESEFNIIEGDINQDQLINIQDVILCINIILENIIPDEIEFSSADLNNDTSIDVLDVVLIVNIILDR